jgi:hypothetical protein
MDAGWSSASELKKRTEIKMCKRTHGLAGRAAAVDPGAALGLDVVLLPLAEVAEQPPRAAAPVFALYFTFFLGTKSHMAGEDR